MECNCAEFKEGMKQIVAVQVLSSVRTGYEYTGASFRYCPWCGNVLGTSNEGGKRQVNQTRKLDCVGRVDAAKTNSTVITEP